MCRITDKIAASLIIAACLALLACAARLAAEQPPQAPAETAAATAEAQGQAAEGQVSAAPAPGAGCPAAPPAPPAPPAEAPKAPAAKAPCPPLPGEHEEFFGPYWTEKRLDDKPFICPQYSYPEKAARKFGRGVANVVTAPIELFNQPLNYLCRTERSGFIPNATALVVGVPAGVGWVIYRALAGAFDIVTFAVPPFRPVIHPEFVSNDFQKRRILQIKSPEELKHRLEN